MIAKPLIIENTFEFFYEPKKINYPKRILVIENKCISQDTIKMGGISYSDKNTSSPHNILNLFHKIHTIYISNLFNKNNNISDYITSNIGFAYHYFIDKMGNIYRGRPHSVKPFNLDIYTQNENDSTKYELLPTSNSIFSENIIILTEQSTDNEDTTNETYTSLSSLIRYLKSTENIKDYSCYSELKRFDIVPTSIPEESNIRYNNPGVFFKINELRSAVDLTIIDEYQVYSNGIKEYSYGKRNLKYNRVNPQTGNDIIMVQKLLYSLNLLTNFKQVNGVYDLITQKAIEQFQRLNYIKPERDYGIADENTLSLLRRNVYNDENSNIIDYSKNMRMYRVLEYRPNNPMMGNDVKFIQMLIKEKFLSGQNISCIYDKETANNISYLHKYFNKRTRESGQSLELEIFDNDLGKVGPITWELLNKIDGDLIISIQNKWIDFNGNYKGESIRILQEALNNLFNKNLNITEIYDDDTAQLIENLNSNDNNLRVMNITLPKDENYQKKFCTREEYEYLIKKYYFDK